MKLGRVFRRLMLISEAECPAGYRFRLDDLLAEWDGDEDVARLGDSEPEVEGLKEADDEAKGPRDPDAAILFHQSAE